MRSPGQIRLLAGNPSLHYLTLLSSMLINSPKVSRIHRKTKSGSILTFCSSVTSCKGNSTWRTTKNCVRSLFSSFVFVDLWLPCLQRSTYKSCDLWMVVEKEVPVWPCLNILEQAQCFAISIHPMCQERIKVWGEAFHSWYLFIYKVLFSENKMSMDIQQINSNQLLKMCRKNYLTL